MFGMLDYRAHKLFLLLTFPLRVIGWGLWMACIFLAIVIVRMALPDGPTLQKTLAALGGSIALMLIGYFVLLAIGVSAARAFFWCVDVIPSAGRTPEEAETFVIRGAQKPEVPEAMKPLDTWNDHDIHQHLFTLAISERTLFQRRVIARINDAIEEMRMCRLANIGWSEAEWDARQRSVLEAHLKYRSSFETILALAPMALPLLGLAVVIYWIV